MKSNHSCFTVFLSAFTGPSATLSNQVIGIKDICPITIPSRNNRLVSCKELVNSNTKGLGSPSGQLGLINTDTACCRRRCHRRRRRHLCRRRWIWRIRRRRRTEPSRREELNRRGRRGAQRKK